MNDQNGNLDLIDGRIGHWQAFVGIVVAVIDDAGGEHYPVRATGACQLYRSNGYGHGPVACPHEPDRKGEFLPRFYCFVDNSERDNG
jgi:hypothetical protein